MVKIFQRLNKFKKDIKKQFFSFKNKIFADQIYISRKENRSISENSIYSSEIICFLKNQKEFNNFKRNFHYRKIVETVTEELGYEYLKILESRDDEILKKGLRSVLISDEIGNPLRYIYDGYDIPLSPTTLRYLKVSSDLNSLFGNKLGKVAEIGSGYGGQTLINDQLLDVFSAKLFDLPYVNKLINKYLNHFCLKGSYQTTFINNEIPHDYDLVISNYAFSELPKNLQITYIKKVLSKSKRGYITMNSGLGGDFSENKLSIFEIMDFIPNIKLLEEEPKTYKFNYIAVWDNIRELKIPENFKEKIIKK